MYDYLIVGAGLYGSVFAHEATKKGKKCLVIDKRDHFGGNAYCKSIEGINVHMYGAHIFHTSDKDIWDYMNQFCTFNHYTNSPIANYHGELYNLPFNMNTFSKLWGVTTPQEAKEKIEEQKKSFSIIQPQNLEEQAISLVGYDIYKKLIKGYTEKQWGKLCNELPAFIIKRLPVRFTFDNNYFNDPYQGIPKGGYNVIFEKLLDGVEMKLGVNYFDDRDHFNKLADRIVFTGYLDAFYDYRFGALEYRSLRFEHRLLAEENHQGVAVMNYTDAETPFTRILEHKHFEFGKQDKTVITKEYPQEWRKGTEPYYPVNDEKNNEKYMQYKALTEKEKKFIFGGRLADYRYYDMWQVVKNALRDTKNI